MITGQTIAYKRVSSEQQNTERQLDGMTFDKVFEEKVSGGKASNRPALQAMIEHVRSGDVVFVHDVSRLARNTKDLLETVEKINAKGCTITFKKENLTFSGNADDATSKLLLTLLGAVAAFTKTIINEAQAEGIATAKKNGVHLGRSEKLSKEAQQELLDKVNAGANKVSLAKEYGISRATLYNILKPAKVVLNQHSTMINKPS